jgi:hypothetical protein
MRKNSTGDLVSPASPEINDGPSRWLLLSSACHSPELEAMSTVKGDWMHELLDGFHGSIKDEKASHVGPAELDIAYQRLGKGDSYTYGHTSDTSIV